MRNYLRAGCDGARGKRAVIGRQGSSGRKKRGKVMNDGRTGGLPAHPAHFSIAANMEGDEETFTIDLPAIVESIIGKMGWMGWMGWHRVTHAAGGAASVVPIDYVPPTNRGTGGAA
jgi:hypothetical protein